MDVRLYIYGGLALLGAVLAISALVALARYRRALRTAEALLAAADEEREAYLGPTAEHVDDVFSVGRTSASAPAPAHAPIREADLPVVRRAPEPAAAPEHEPAPEPAPAPGYSLADEIDRLAAATVASQGLLTAEEHAETVSAVSTAAAAPAVEIPEPPPVTLGAALSPEAKAEAPAPVPASREELRAEPPAEPPPYTLVAPVELHFTEGAARIGVKPGTRTYAEFQRLAAGLLDDLGRSRSG